jgi:hypothetical protein
MSYWRPHTRGGYPELPYIDRERVSIAETMRVLPVAWMPALWEKKQISAIKLISTP